MIRNWFFRPGTRLSMMAILALAVLLLVACRPATPEPPVSAARAEAVATVQAELESVRKPEEVPAGIVEYHMSPTCGCCEVHKESMELFSEENGLQFDLHLQESTTLNYLKRAAGIPPTHWSCHTAYVDGYYLEGHVPIDAVRWLLAAKPDNVKGIATRHAEGETSQETWLGEVYYIIYEDGTIQGPIPADVNELSLIP
jgi:hypothetical protein